MPLTLPAVLPRPPHLSLCAEGVTGAVRKGHHGWLQVFPDAVRTLPLSWAARQPRCPRSGILGSWTSTCSMVFTSMQGTGHAEVPLDRQEFDAFPLPPCALAGRRAGLVGLCGIGLCFGIGPKIGALPSKAECVLHPSLSFPRPMLSCWFRANMCRASLLPFPPFHLFSSFRTHA